MDGFFHQSLRWYIPASLQIYFRSAFPSLFFFFFFPLLVPVCSLLLINFLLKSMSQDSQTLGAEGKTTGSSHQAYVRPCLQPNSEQTQIAASVENTW